MSCLSFILSFLIIILVFVYVRVLLKERKGEKFWTPGLITGVVVTGTVGILIHAVVLSNMGGGKDWLTIGAMSLVSTAEMFVGSTKMFDNGFNDYLFPNHPEYVEGFSDVCLILLTGAFLAALITSGYIVMNFFFWRLNSRSWLKNHCPENGQKIHIFFGDNPNSRLLSNDVLASNPDDRILRIDYPQKGDTDLDASLWSRLLAAFSSKSVSNAEGITILKSRCSLSSVNPDDFTRSFGLNLKNWLTPDTIVYLLSDDEATNRKELRVLLQTISKSNRGDAGKEENRITCKKIYCHGRRSELDVESEYAYLPEKGKEKDSQYPEIIFRDSSKLAIRGLLQPGSENQKSALPVDYVSIAVDREGNKLGYVDSAFKSIIVGLGETGLEALKFLYEYASFPNKDGEKIPFFCRIFDKDIPSQRKAFYEELYWAEPLTVGDGKKGGELEFVHAEVNTESFWTKFEAGIEEVNYIFICLGDDKLNLSVANSILNHHLKGRDTSSRFVIMLKQRNPDEMLTKIIRSINEKNNNCIRVFGQASDIWRYSVISDAPIEEDAIRYYTTYQKANTYPIDFVEGEAPKMDITPTKWDDFIWGASEEQKKQIEADWISYLSDKKPEQKRDLDLRWSEELREKWNNRNETIRSGHLKDRTQCLRQRTQDISNVLHASTKLALIPDSMLKRAEMISNAIPGKFFGKFYDVEDEPTEAILRLLAIEEHLRWNASHTILGYRPGDKTNDLLKTHKYLKSYDELGDEAVQHYDWLVVKTTLRLYAESSPSKEQSKQGQNESHSDS